VRRLAEPPVYLVVAGEAAAGAHVASTRNGANGMAA
jgi:hypothetical protein